MPSTRHIVCLVAAFATIAMLKNFQMVFLFGGGQTLAASEGSLPFRNNETLSIPNNPVDISNDNITVPTSFLIHRAIFGLGHRLLRTTAAWHLAQRLGIQAIKFQWGTCDNDQTTGPQIFPYLFGNDEWKLPVLHAVSSKVASDKTMQYSPNPPGVRTILVRNDVYGYLPAQTYQDFRLPLPVSYHPNSSLNNLDPFHSKLASDVSFYKSLRNSFLFREEIIHPFMDRHDFSDHTVIGLHLRAGNGEATHFSESGRYIANETEFVLNLASLVQSLVIDLGATTMESNKKNAKPPILFLATDSAYLVPVLSNATQQFGVETIVLPQIRLEKNKGVTFSALKGAGDKCLLGWQAMVADMILLSHSDVLIAASHSTFTQSMPMSLIFHEKGKQIGPHFCEVSLNATTMTCLQDMDSWLFRDDPKKRWSYSIPNENGSELLIEYVKHKALIHLPDPQAPPEFSDAITFLSQSAQNGHVESNIHTYGKSRFNPKYRRKKPSHTPGWNFTLQ